MRGNGFLAIWSDVDRAKETDYLHWLTREHTAERLGVPGFLAVRVFKATQTAVPRFLIVYELEDAGVLASPGYLARLNAPTPWSQRIMPILGNFVRGGGRRVFSRGTGAGSHVAALRWSRDTPGDLGAAADALVGCDRIAAVHHLATDQTGTGIATNEKKLRANDTSFADLLLVEALDAAALEEALTQSRAPVAAATGATETYAQIFSL